MSLMKKVFCVEDDDNIRELIEYTLTSAGFAVVGFSGSDDLFNTLKTENPDVILLDIMLPGKDGMAILKELRQSSKNKNTPVIMLTAKSSQIDKIKGLDCGADDYIVKPFDVLELISRIKALLRRTTASEINANRLEYKNLVIDIETRQVSVSGEPVNLTFKEFELLWFLIYNKGVVLTRNTIMNDVWGTDFEGESRTVDVHIRTLRHKLGKCGNYIETVRNVGYKVG